MEQNTQTNSKKEIIINDIATAVTLILLGGMVLGLLYLSNFYYPIP